MCSLLFYAGLLGGKMCLIISKIWSDACIEHRLAPQWTSNCPPKHEPSTNTQTDNSILGQMDSVLFPIRAILLPFESRSFVKNSAECSSKQEIVNLTVDCRFHDWESLSWCLKQDPPKDMTNAWAIVNSEGSNRVPLCGLGTVSIC